MPYLYVVRYPSLCVRQAGYISQTKDKQALCDTFISDIRSLMKSVCGMKISLSRTPHNATPQLNPVPTNHSVSDSNHVKSLLEHHVKAFLSQNACEYSWSSWKCGILVLPCSVSEYLVNYYGLWSITTQFYQRMLWYEYFLRLHWYSLLVKVLLLFVTAAKQTQHNPGFGNKNFRLFWCTSTETSPVDRSW